MTLSEQVEEQLSPAARAKLAEQGFVIVPADFRLFHHAYDEQFWWGTPVFVTTDAAYHAWHQVFDKTLRDLETKKLLPALEKLIKGMRRNARAQVEELAGTPLADDAAAVYDLLTVAAAELGLKTGALSDRARAEKKLIDAHSEATVSPVLGTTTDYSLFTPRGHYTRTRALTRYFVAMSVLGQHAFRLPGSIQTDASTVEDARGVQLALLASRTLVGYPRLEALWSTIFEPTAFLVGVSDDYSPFELADAVEGVMAGGFGDPVSVADDATLRAVADALTAARPVQIDPERPSVRLMGTRFVLDSWILDQLVGPCVGEPAPDQRRYLGSPLDLAATFGSDFALGIQEDAGETGFLNYPEQMAALRSAVAERPAEAWGATVYDAWLNAVEPMWLPHGAAFPDFMQSDPWKAKSQQTGFGSYAELKHDTILYTKQAVGEMGSAGEPPFAYNWVEPDPVVFGRLGVMAELTRDGLVERDLLDKGGRRLLDDYIKLVGRFERIAADELAGEAAVGGRQRLAQVHRWEARRLLVAHRREPHVELADHRRRRGHHRRRHARHRLRERHRRGARDRHRPHRPHLRAGARRGGAVPRQQRRGLLLLRVPLADGGPPDRRGLVEDAQARHGSGPTGLDGAALPLTTGGEGSIRLDTSETMVWSGEWIRLSTLVICT